MDAILETTPHENLTGKDVELRLDRLPLQSQLQTTDEALELFASVYWRNWRLCGNLELDIALTESLRSHDDLPPVTQFLETLHNISVLFFHRVFRNNLSGENAEKIFMLILQGIGVHKTMCEQELVGKTKTG